MMLKDLGIIGFIIFLIIVGLIPIVATILVGTAFATMLGFTGILWWAFVILFWLVITAILNCLDKTTKR